MHAVIAEHIDGLNNEPAKTLSRRLSEQVSNGLFIKVARLGQNEIAPEKCLTRHEKLDDRQITHPSCVRLKHLLYDFLGGV